MNMLLVEPENIAPDNTFTATHDQSEHIACVLRAKIGDIVKIGVLGGNIGMAKIRVFSKKNMLLEILNLDSKPPEKKKQQYLIALPRPQSFKKCLHFLASSGIPSASFIQTERVEKSYWTSSALFPQNIEKEIKLGLEQGVDTIPPELTFFHSFAEWKNHFLSQNFDGVKLIAHPVNAISCPSSIDKQVLSVIGPEGGFLQKEVNDFTEMGFQCVNLGPFILRVEFALSFMCGKITPL